MGAIVAAGYEPNTKRQLYLLELENPEALTNIDLLPDAHFACFIAWDARDASPEVASTVLERLLDAGASYLSVWGPDCERVHDIADEIRSEQLASGHRLDSVVITTWHEHESLDDALWFFLFNTFPDRSFEATTHSALAVTIGNREWSRGIRKALLDPTAFARKIEG